MIIIIIIPLPDQFAALVPDHILVVMHILMMR
jgi:hypothetical protein